MRHLHSLIQHLLKLQYPKLPQPRRNFLPLHWALLRNQYPHMLLMLTEVWQLLHHRHRLHHLQQYAAETRGHKLPMHWRLLWRLSNYHLSSVHFLLQHLLEYLQYLPVLLRLWQQSSVQRYLPVHHRVLRQWHYLLLGVSLRVPDLRWPRPSFMLLLWQLNASRIVWGVVPVCGRLLWQRNSTMSAMLVLLPNMQFVGHDVHFLRQFRPPHAGSNWLQLHSRVLRRWTACCLPLLPLFLHQLLRWHQHLLLHLPTQPQLY